MIQFLDLPEEIILELIVRFLSISECVNLVSVRLFLTVSQFPLKRTPCLDAVTCRLLHKFTHLKSYWLRIAHFARQTRPIPFGEADSRLNLSIEKIRDATVCSMKLGKMMKQRLLPKPRRIRELVLPDIPTGESLGNEAEDMGPRGRDPQIWAWLLKDGKHLMSMSKVGILKVWDIWNEKVVASMDVVGQPLCWDYMMDEKGLTMIVNVDTKNDGSELETFRVWRYDWIYSEPKPIFKKVLQGDVRSNWIEGDLTGCVGIADDGYNFIYVVNWVTCQESYIETEFGLPTNLSAATSPEMLFIWAENTTHAAYYAYSLSTLSESLVKPMQRLTVTRAIEQHFRFRQDGVNSLNFWIPTCRTLWDGRTGVFSRSMRMAPPPENFVADYVTLSIVEMTCDSNGAVMERHSGGKVTRQVAHWFDPEGSELLAAPADWDVCAMGTFAKTAVWMERVRRKESEEKKRPGRIRICFAEFPGEEDNITDHKAGGDKQSSAVSGSSSRASSEMGDRDQETASAASDQPSPVGLEDWWDALIGEPGIANNMTVEGDEEVTMGSTVPPATLEENSSTTPPEVSPEGPSAHPPAVEPDVFDPMPDHSESDGMPLDDLQPPVSFGHFSEYMLDEDWEQQYGGIYTVDFDDARGLIAFATGSGKIVLLDLV